MSPKKTAAVNHLVQPVIVQILPALERGGVERGTLEVSRAIIAAGWRSVVISNGGYLENQLRRIGAVHHKLPVHTKNPFAWGSVRRRVKQVLMDEHADLVHVRSRAPGWISLPAAKSLDIPTVSTIHSKFQASNLIKHSYNAKMLSSDHVIAISNYVDDVLRTQYSKHYRGERQTVIHRGADIEAFDPANVSQPRIVREAERINLPLDVPVVMLPARATSWKGHEALIEAMAQRSDKNFCLVLLGVEANGSGYAEKLRNMALRLGLGGQIKLAGVSDDMPAALMLADVVVMPSTLPEPFGRVAIEAQAMGRPIIAFDHGGAVESVIDGTTGWLARPNDVDALAEAVDKALSLNAKERDALAITARAHIVKKFSVEKMCKETLAVYANLLGL